MKRCKFIVTDSGGIQEETTSPKIRKKVVVVRKTTDRPEAVKLGLSELSGITTKSIKQAIIRNSLNSKIPKSGMPYGNGNTSHKIMKIIYCTY